VSVLEARDFREESIVPVTMERHEGYWLIQLEDGCTVTSAAELKSVLLEGLASGKALRLDLEQAGEIDITLMQLLWAAGSEAERTGASIAIHASEAVRTAAREAGFEGFPGLAFQGDGWPR
jgi:MFS superfamily sulfate permease-like transporter